MQIGRLTERVRHELIEYAFNVAYLTLVFAAFLQYRRFLLAEYSITYTNYWLALIGALILGKVIMIGSVFRLGRWLEDKPLIVPTIYKAVIFSAFVLVFRVVEYAIKGLLHGDGLGTGTARRRTPAHARTVVEQRRGLGPEARIAADAT